MRQREVYDVCLLLEGTYPYVAGGVSSWVHDLIKAHPDKTFAALCILPMNAETKLHYDRPANLKEVRHLFLHRPPEGRTFHKDAKRVMEVVGDTMMKIHETAEPDDVLKLFRLLHGYKGKIGGRILLNSKLAWRLIVNMYNQTMPETSFLDYFWSWRGIAQSFFSVALAPLPQAKVYHTLCTGYAGLLGARARIEFRRPLILTEHGIYTNERRIELAVAEWLYSSNPGGLAVEKPVRDLRDLWTSSFVSYSRTCYQCCDHIITLYEGNQVLQLQDGAPVERMRVIPNGIDCEKGAQVVRGSGTRPPTIALIGRVVPIKDVKTYIRAVGILKRSFPQLQALVLGPTDEDEDYYRECQLMVTHLNLQDTVKFMGKVKLDEYFGQIDVLVLTSISEAQPLVILEAGAARVPCVVTDVGACREMIMGRKDENPRLGAGGAVTPLSNPGQTAEAITTLLSNGSLRANCGFALHQRVNTYYNKKSIDRIYNDLYRQCIDSPNLDLQPAIAAYQEEA